MRISSMPATAGNATAAFTRTVQPAPRIDSYPEDNMSKGQDRKKESRKKPGKTLEEKRAVKRQKKTDRTSRNMI